MKAPFFHKKHQHITPEHLAIMELAKEAGYSQKKIAEMLHCHRHVVRKYLNLDQEEDDEWLYVCTKHHRHPGIWLLLYVWRRSLYVSGPHPIIAWGLSKTEVYKDQLNSDLEALTFAYAICVETASDNSERGLLYEDGRVVIPEDTIYPDLQSAIDHFRKKYEKRRTLENPPKWLI